LKFKIFGFTTDDVTFSFIDFYTVGHFIFGFITCLILYLIIGLLFNYPDPYGLCITISINVGLFWEFLENFYLHKKGFKFDDRRDSFANSLTDVLFVNIGAIVCGIISISGIITLFMWTVLILAFTTALYEILRRVTFSKRNNYGKNMEKV